MRSRLRLPCRIRAAGGDVTRDAIVVIAAKGAYTGKPRPAVIVQADLFNPTHSSLTLCPVTSDCVGAPLFRERYRQARVRVCRRFLR